MKRAILSLAVVLTLTGCAGPRPILYPNDHYRQVGPDAAEADIKDCMELAKEAGASPSQGKSAQVATGTVGGGAVGSAAGAVGERFLGIPVVEPWWAQPAGRRPDFFAACFGARRRAAPSRVLSTVACVSGATIRPVGSRCFNALLGPRAFPPDVPFSQRHSHIRPQHIVH